MNRVNYQRCAIVGVFMMFWTIYPSAAEVGRGGYAGSFFRMGLGARAMGMGDVSVAYTDDGCATYYNPASLVFLENRWVTTSLRSMALDRRLTYIGYAQSLGKQESSSLPTGALRGGFSVGWLCGGVTNIDARGYNGEDIGTLSNWEHGFSFSFAINPAPPFAIGFNAKLLYNRMPDITDDGNGISATGFGFDFGLLLKPSPFLAIGLVVKDIGSRYTWDTQDLWEKGTQTIDQFPRVLRFGMAWRLFGDRLILAGDIEQVEGCPQNIKCGIQWKCFQRVFLRAGLKDETITFGGGLRVHSLGRSVQLDYGYVPDPVAPSGNHLFTCSFIL